MVVGAAGQQVGGRPRARQAHRTFRSCDLDSHYWQPGWRATPSAAWRTKGRELMAEPAWVTDGNYTSTLDLRLPAADKIVFLDLPRALTLAVRRLGQRGPCRGACGRASATAGERHAPGFLLWIWRYPQDGPRASHDHLDPAQTNLTDVLAGGDVGINQGGEPFARETLALLTRRFKS
jgi:hypothetical protein